jgi:uracil-DNA glycosylase family 4
MTPYQQHKADWSECRKCKLCEGRTKVCLVRGSLPAQVLFLGEAPGPSEDVIGKPFFGPAGDLLQEMIDEAVGTRVTYAFTNLIACIPMDDDNSKFTEPPKYAVEACRPRLIEIIKIVKPRLIFLVGKAAEKYAPSQSEYGVGDMSVCDWLLPRDNGLVHYEKLVHPAFILRADVSQRGLAIQRCVATIFAATRDIFG